VQINSQYWPELSAHQIYWEHHNNPHVYEYDSTDDGPEVEIIRRINFGQMNETLDILNARQS
jgi:hypothetical protein